MSEYEERKPAHQGSSGARQGGGSRVAGSQGGQPPRKKRRRRRRMGALGALLYVVLVIGVSALLAGLGWVWAGDVLALNKEEHAAVITLPEDIFTYTEVTDGEGNPSKVSSADMGYVADVLSETGLIEQKWLFRLFAAFTHGDEEIAPGTYNLDTDMDYRAIIKNMSLKSASKTEVTVLIPEGSTAEQVFALLAENGVCSVDELRETAANYDFKFSFLKGVLPLGDSNRLEGYLFPDTYNFYKNSSAVTVLNKMLLRFDEVFTEDMREKAAANGQTVHDIVTIASLIEKETTGDDQTSISAVIYNRLYKQNSETNGRLDIDATIQYILPERKEKLSDADKTIDSPYNTYLYAGLPAGPIANPGQASLRAAMNPADAGYYFYALGDDGAHHFFKTYAEQRAFIGTQEIYNNG